MNEIFISYKREDREVARTLADALEQEGYSVWWDEAILPGETFDEIIKKRLDVAKCLIVLWSKVSVSSDWVRDEAAEALRRKILVPVVIDEVEIPLGFRRVQAADLRGWKGERAHPEFELLLASVGGLLGGTSRQPLEREKNLHTPGWKRWGLTGTVLVLLAFFHTGVMTSTCANRDLVLITSAGGFLLAAALLVKSRRGYRFLWILGPVSAFVVGMPYGHPYGTMTRSTLFGLQTGTYCQAFEENYYLLAGILSTAIIVDLFSHFWSRRGRRWIPFLFLGALVVAGAYYVKSSVLRYSDQYAYAERLVRKYRFYAAGDWRWSNPTAAGYQNDFQLQGSIVQDNATGLFWQKGGSPESIGFAQIAGYLRKLNAERLGGYDDWRLPTLAEAWTLLTYRTQEGRHIERIFDSGQRWIWTSTTTNDGYGWFVNFEAGYPMFQNAWGSHAYVRAVRGPRLE